MRCRYRDLDLLNPVGLPASPGSKCAGTLVMLFAGKPKSTPRNPSHLLLQDPADAQCDAH